MLFVCYVLHAGPPSKDEISDARQAKEAGQQPASNLSVYMCHNVLLFCYLLLFCYVLLAGTPGTDEGRNARQVERAGPQPASNVSVTMLHNKLLLCYLLHAGPAREDEG
jgi:hypothetical protein